MRKQIIYTISARGKKLNQRIDKFLHQFYPSFSLKDIDSVFGFVEPSTLYSGRPFLVSQISDKDYEILQANNIGLRLPLTNHYCTENEYDNNRNLLLKYHKKGNSIITSNEDLARWIRRDYPLYQIEASILKNINTQEKITEVLKIYNTVVLPMELNNKPDFLESLEQKDKITLFGNAGCALSCPNRICYKYFSKHNKKLATKPIIQRYLYFFYNFGVKNKWCMYKIKPRKLHGIKDFNLNRLSDLGYSRFKMLRENKKRNTGY